MHVTDFPAVGNGHTCDDNHPHELYMHTGRNPGKTSALGRYEFVAGLRRDGSVWYGMVR